MRTLGEMADRSDRREEKPITCLGVRTRPTDWLLTRGFLFGQEIPGSTRAQPLHSQAGDTTAVLTLCHKRINTHRNRYQDTHAPGRPESSFPPRLRARHPLKPSSGLPQDAFSQRGWLPYPSPNSSLTDYSRNPEFENRGREDPQNFLAREEESRYASYASLRFPRSQSFAVGIHVSSQ